MARAAVRGVPTAIALLTGALKAPNEREAEEMFVALCVEQMTQTEIADLFGALVGLNVVLLRLLSSHSGLPAEILLQRLALVFEGMG